MEPCVATAPAGLLQNNQDTQAAGPASTSETVTDGVQPWLEG